MNLAFLDSNIFIYAVDRDDPCRQRRAACVISELQRSARGVLSTQVVGEFVRVTSAGPRDDATMDSVEAYARKVLTASPEAAS